MQFKQVIKSALLGLSLPQEYLCVGHEDLDSLLSIYLTGSDPSLIINITNNQLFIGYKPFTVAVTLPKSTEDAEWLRRQDRVSLTFTSGIFASDDTREGFVSDRNAIARLTVRKIKEKELGDRIVVIFIGEYGEHKFLSPFHQAVNRLVNRFKKQNPTNVNLPGNLYDQIRIAYATPRVISIISVRHGEMMNMFPTDLHGAVNENFYISSLRIGGKASEQVEQAGTIALSNVKADWSKIAYSLGKNHMADLTSKENFRLSSSKSKGRQLPLPESVIRYCELKRVDSFDVGLHRIYFYEILNEEKICEGVTLAHIHYYYAQWRLNHGLLVAFLAH